MAYIGKQPVVGNFQICDAISVVNGQAAYTMQVGSANVEPENANHMLVSLNGILQKPGSSFTISGATITFASNLATGDVIDFIILLGDTLNVGTPSDSSITSAKLNNSMISGLTALTDAPADTDEFIISDAGTLKRIDASLVGGGLVKQVVYASNATNVTFTNATYGDVITVNITPTKSTSDILIQANLTLTANSTTGQDQGTAFKILRDSTEILTSGGYQQYIYSNGANIDTRMNFSVAYLDTAHSTTSQITYKIQGNNNTGGGSLTFNGDGKSTIWVMELDQ